MYISEIDIKCTEKFLWNEFVSTGGKSAHFNKGKRKSHDWLVLSEHCKKELRSHSQTGNPCWHSAVKLFSECTIVKNKKLHEKHGPDKRKWQYQWQGGWSSKRSENHWIPSYSQPGWFPVMALQSLAGGQELLPQDSTNGVGLQAFREEVLKLRRNLTLGTEEDSCQNPEQVNKSTFSSRNWGESSESKMHTSATRKQSRRTHAFKREASWQVTAIWR